MAAGAPETAPQPRLFPPRAVPEVHVRNVCQTACGGPFAIVVADFEPLPDEEFAPLVVDWPERDRWRRTGRRGREWLPQEYADALETGLRTALTELPAPWRAATWVTVTSVRWHEIDSYERGFTQAGGMLVREAVRRCGG